MLSRTAHRLSVVPINLNKQISALQTPELPPQILFEEKTKILDDIYAMPSSPKNKVLPLQTPTFEKNYIISYFSRLLSRSNRLHEDRQDNLQSGSKRKPERFISVSYW